MNKTLLRIAFVLALIIAVALIAIVVIRFSPRFFSYISSASASLFNVFKKEALIIEVRPQTVVSGGRVVLTWPTENQEAVSLTYGCSNQYTLSYLGGSNTRIPVRCGEAFKLGGTTGGVTIIPTLSNSNSFSDIEIEIEQERTDDIRSSGLAVITVTSGTTTDATTTRATSTRPYLATSTPSQHAPSRTSPEPRTVITTPVVSGPANLILSQPQYVHAGSAAVQFTVANNGGKNSGTWELRASLPNGEIFNSGALAGIPAGGSTLFTLYIGTLSSGSNTVRITIDPNNAINESNENDNSKEVRFNNGSGGTSGKDADLTVRVLSIGYIQGDMIGIRFEVRNIGGKTAEDWYFEAELPTQDEEDEEFVSSRQTDLKPGEAIEYTLGFDDARSNGYATIVVDTEDDVEESNERNNSVRFRVTN